MKDKKYFVIIILLAVSFVITSVIIVVRSNVVRRDVEYHVGSVGAASVISSRSSALRDSLRFMTGENLKHSLVLLQNKNSLLDEYPELKKISLEVNGLQAYISKNNAVNISDLEADLIKIKNDCDKAISAGRKKLGADSEQLAGYWGYTHFIITIACMFMILVCYMALSLIKAKQLLKKRNEELYSVNKEMEAFSYSVAHDLRAPLRSVNSYAHMLNENYSQTLGDEGKRFITIIRSNAIKMGKLIDDLLEFSRLGRQKLKKETIDMNALTLEIVADIERSTSHHAKIKIGDLHNLYGDPGLIKQAMFNLISNAIKYSSKKENPVVQISSEEKNEGTVFSVKDNGAGFDMKYANKLFNVFQRLHGEKEFEGTGIGLAIVHQIIGKHNGKVFAEGKVNEGAFFCFILPKN